MSRKMQNIRFFVQDCLDDVVNPHGVPGRELEATGARDLLQHPGLTVDPDLGITKRVAEQAEHLEHLDRSGLHADLREKSLGSVITRMITRSDGKQERQTVTDHSCFEPENHLWPKRFG